MTSQVAFLLLVTLAPVLAFPQSRNASTLIVGGVEAGKGEFPFIVDMRRFSSHTCGGSIVSADWVVTAAHCTQGAIGDYELVAGDHNVHVEEGTEQRRKVVRIVNHPSYRPGTYENDISLLKVETPFVLNERVQPAALPVFGFAPTKDVTTAGWGRTTEGGSSPSALQKVTVPYITDEVCNAAYSGRIYESMICAGLLGEGGKDACQGDSGGPLLCGQHLCGLVSWGTGCARPNYPGVYTEVSYFTSWVNDVIATS